MDFKINQSKASSIILCLKMIELLENEKSCLLANMQGDISDVYAELMEKEIEQWKRLLDKIRRI